MPSNKFNFPFAKFFKKKALSVYQISLILIVSSSFLSILIFSIVWVVSESNEVKKEISLLKENALEIQKEKLQQEVLHLVSYLEFIQKDTIIYTPEQIKNKALLYFESIRFGNDGYVFVNTYSGDALLFNGKKLEEPKKMSDLNYPSGLDFYQVELDLAKLPNGGSFQYEFFKIDDDKPYPKLSYIMGFDRWEWILGAGDYLDNLQGEIILMETELKSNLYKGILYVIGIFIPILILLLFFSNYAAKFIQKQFDRFLKIVKEPVPNNSIEPPFKQIYIQELKAIGMDILQAEELVKQFGNIIDQSNHDIYVFLKDDLQIIHANKGAIQNSGFSISELQKMTFLDLMPDINNEQFLALSGPLKINQSEKIQFESVYQQEDKTAIPIDVQLTLSNFNNKKVYVAFIYDITDRKKAEQALLASQNFNEKLLITSPDLIYVYDIIDRKNVYSNQRIIKILGYSKYEIQKMGKNLISHLMHPDDYKVYLNEIIPRYQSAKDGEIIEHEYRMKHKNGNWCWLNSKESVFIRLDNETPKQIFGIITDITNRKIAEEELNKYHEKLELLVKERTLELESKSNRLVKLNKVFIGRELRMAELKKEIEELKGN